jgi:GxxExxY protein
MNDQKTNNYLYQEESGKIISACYEVHNLLGGGFLEAVYHEALEIVLKEKQIPFESEKKLEIQFKNVMLKKHYYADIICYGQIILELKACEALTHEHTSQMLNYLRATGLKLGLLINFGTPKVQIKRVIL